MILNNSGCTGIGTIPFVSLWTTAKGEVLYLLSEMIRKEVKMVTVQYYCKFG